MRVVHLTAAVSETSAPLRIHNALKFVGVDSKLAVLDTKIKYDYIMVIPKSTKYKIKNRLLYYQNQYKLKKFCDRENVPFSFGDIGVSLYRHPIVLEADIIHLHWINGQYLSYKDISKLVALGKPIVWTFHDSWPMTGGCHVRYGCEGFQKECGKCPLLHSKKENDFTREIIEKKKKYYHTEFITTVSPSCWMHLNVNKSALFQKSYNVQIGNPLDVSVYTPTNLDNHEEVRILFGASGALELEYKGYYYFAAAMQYLYEKYPDLASRIVIYIFGTEVVHFKELMRYPCIAKGYIHSEKELVQVYQSADIYVFPSIDDNLPGTVMECLACETPVVAFQTGGVPEMVHHKEDGYVAEYKNAIDLAEGIVWVCNNNQANKLGKNGRKIIIEKYSMEDVGMQYKNLYEELCQRDKRR